MHVDSKLKPLISDLKKTNIDSYLATSIFERLTVKLGFSELWDDVLREAESNRRVFVLGMDHKRGDSERALFTLLDWSFRGERELFDKLVYSILQGYILWVENNTKLEDVFVDLEILHFSKEWLENLRELYSQRIKDIEQKEKLKLEKQELEKVDRIESSAIIKAKKVEWIDKLSRAELEFVLEELKNYAIENSLTHLIKEIVNQSQRWFRLQRKVRDGVIDLDDEQKEANKINKAVLEIISSIESKLAQ